MTRVFISQDSTTRIESEWTERFIASLHSAGFTVSAPGRSGIHVSAANLDRDLRDSDAIVFLLTSPASLQSLSMFFNFGVASFGHKEIVSVVGRTVDANEIPIRELRSRPIAKSSATRTAAKVAERLHELTRKYVA